MKNNNQTFPDGPVGTFMTHDKSGFGITVEIPLSDLVKDPEDPDTFTLPENVAGGALTLPDGRVLLVPRRPDGSGYYHNTEDPGQ